MTSENHSCERWLRRLDDFVDERLAPGEQTEVQRHLDGCESCRRQAAELEGLLAAARDLPRSLQPPWDSWPEIEARLSPRARGPRLHGWIPQAIAAALLIAFGGISSRLLWPPSAATEIAEARIRDEQAIAAGAIELARAETEYLRVKESLWISVYHHQAELSPMTVSVVEHNLQTIDQAIEEIHQALEQDPGNPRLEKQLFANHRRGIGLLRRLATAPNET